MAFAIAAFVLGRYVLPKYKDTIQGAVSQFEFILRYAESFCAEIHLPDMPDTKESMVRLIAIIKAFLEAEGSSMQFNLVDREQLLEARKHPELHKNLLVRVCGYSAVYVSLAEETQEEILQRAIR